MGAPVKAMTKIQIGVETTRGTRVAATRRLIGDGRFRIMNEQEEFEDQMTGVLSRSVLSPVRTFQNTEFEFRYPLDFEQILFPLLSGMVGGETPDTVDTTVKRWIFLPSQTADPAIKTYTLEWAETDLTDTLMHEAGYCFCTEFEVTFGTEALPEIVCRFVGQEAVESTVTGAIALPTLHHAPNLKSSVWMDPAFADVGTTQITGQVYTGRFKFGGFVFPQRYMDGDTDISFQTHHFKQRTAEMEFDIISSPTSGSFLQTMQDDKAAGTAKAFQIKILGDIVAGAASSHRYGIFLNMWGIHAADSLQERGNDRDGNMVTRVHLKSLYDGTSGADLSVVVDNLLATFPS